MNWLECVYVSWASKTERSTDGVGVRRRFPLTNYKNEANKSLAYIAQ
jgi:hypothetical protein